MVASARFVPLLAGSLLAVGSVVVAESQYQSPEDNSFIQVHKRHGDIYVLNQGSGENNLGTGKGIGPRRKRRKRLEEDTTSTTSAPSFTTFINTNIQTVDPNDWLRECAPQLRYTPGPCTSYGVLLTCRSRYSQYDNIEAPSGLCMNSLACAFYQCFWTDNTTNALNSSDLKTVTFEEIQEDLYNKPLNLPSKVTFPRSVRDVVEAVKYANTFDYKISVKTSGHSYPGSSTMNNSLLVNLREFPKYSRTSITECNKSAEAANITAACNLTLARKKNAHVRVGGGELWDDVFRAVLDWNDRNKELSKVDRDKYDILGGGVGSVGAAGGWLQGGGLSKGQERKWGLGVDQVLQLEMVLADGSHVKFGPTTWTDLADLELPYLYPQTTKVEGKCNRRVSTVESEWEWESCQDKHDDFFQGLWKAVRGGGGGTYGIVTAVHYQLHDFEEWYKINPNFNATDAMLKTCNATDYGPCKQFLSLWIPFTTDFFYNTYNPLVPEKVRNACGTEGHVFTPLGGSNPWAESASQVSDREIMYCLGKEAADGFVQAWQTYAKAKCDDFQIAKPWNTLCNFTDIPDILMTFLEPPGTLQTLSDWGTQNIDSYARHFLALGMLPEFASFSGASFPVKPRSIGRIPDPSVPASVNADNGGRWSVLVPIAALSNAFFMEIVMGVLVPEDALMHITGGKVRYASDGMDSISHVMRSLENGTEDSSKQAAFQIQIPAGMVDERALTNNRSGYDWEKYFRGNFSEWFMNGTAFLGGTEYNHISPDVVGPLNSTDGPTTEPCPRHYNEAERLQNCISMQETVWGTNLLHALESIKDMVDPDGRFDCYMCVKNTRRPSGPRI